MNIFWETIAQYNAGTWIYQLIITLVGLWLTYSLFHHPTPAKKKGMKLYLIFINAWVAVVYYHIYCDPRSYSNALALFWAPDSSNQCFYERETCVLFLIRCSLLSNIHSPSH